MEHADRAFALNQHIPQIYMTRSFLHLAQREHDAAMADARKLVELYPNYADSHAALAFVSNYSGELEVGLEAIKEAKRLNPKYSYIYLAVEGHLNFLKGRYEKALALYEEALERNPVFDRGLLLFAAALAHMGNIDDATWAIAEALSIRPDLTLRDERRDANYRRPEDLERYIEGLRKAGLPE
jgi:tetratricopeptide (TPR) repeat protein